MGPQTGVAEHKVESVPGRRLQTRNFDWKAFKSGAVFNFWIISPRLSSSVYATAQRLSHDDEAPSAPGGGQKCRRVCTAERRSSRPWWWILGPILINSRQEAAKTDATFLQTSSLRHFKMENQYISDLPFITPGLPQTFNSCKCGSLDLDMTNKWNIHHSLRRQGKAVCFNIWAAWTLTALPGRGTHTELVTHGKKKTKNLSVFMRT